MCIRDSFLALWSDPRTPQRERKRMVRLLLDDVTLARGDQIMVHVRFRGGQTTSIEVPAPLTAPDLRRTLPEIVSEVDRLLDHHTDAGLAAALNEAGLVSGTGQAFHAGIIFHVRHTYSLRSREDRLRELGWVGVGEIARHLGVCTSTIKSWYHAGLPVGTPFNDKAECLYEIPAVAPAKKMGRPLKNRRPAETLPELA